MLLPPEREGSGRGVAAVGHQWSGHVGGSVMPLGVSRPSRLEQTGPIIAPANTFQNSWILSVIHI